MTDDAHTPGAATADSHDDDRLLAHVLGTDDNPELAAAADRDEALCRRLSAMAAEVDAVRDALDAIAPAPDAAYADPASPRWRQLREHMTAPTAPGRRPWLSLRVLAPAAAVVLAVAAGLTVIAQQTIQAPPGPYLGDSAGEFAGETSDARPAGAKSETQAALQEAEASRASLRRALTLARRADRAGRFRLVVVAQAGDASGVSQEYLVIDDVRGSAVGTLRLEPAGLPVEAEGLYLLLLQPARPTGAILAVAESGARQDAASDAAESTEPATPGAAPAEEARPLLVLSHDGRLALAVPLPAGTDPATVRLP